MADPKSKVQNAIELLNDLKGYLDEEIKNYEKAKRAVDANRRVSENKRKMNEAKAEIGNQITRIDKLIMSNPEVRELIGSKDIGDAASLNAAIEEVLKEVERVKGLKITDLKDTSGNKVSLDTDTGKVAEGMKKLNAQGPYMESVDYTKLSDIEAKIQALEIKMGGEEAYNQYQEVKTEISKKTTPPTKLEDVDVADEYIEFTSDFSDKLDEYKKYVVANNIPAKKFRETLDRLNSKKITKGTFSNTGNRKFIDELITALKGFAGDEKVQLNGVDVQIKDLDFNKLSNDAKNAEDMKIAISKMCTLCENAQGQVNTKQEEMKKALSSSIPMKMFADDKTRMEAALNANPVNVTELDKILGELTDISGKNFDTLDRMEKMDPNHFARMQSELKRLKTLRDSIKAEDMAKAQFVQADEIDKINVAGRIIDVKKGKKYTGRVVDASDPDDILNIVEATFKKLKPEDKQEIRQAVIDDSILNGDNLPFEIPFISKFFAKFFRGGLTRKEEAIRARMKNRIQDSIKFSQADKKAYAEGVQEGVNEKIEEATQAKKDAFALDAGLRDTINAKAYEAARKQILDSKGATDVKKAYSEAGKKAEKEAEEGR